MHRYASEVADPVILRERLGFEQPPYRLPYEQMDLSAGIGVLGLPWVMHTMTLPAYRAARYNLVAGCDINPDRIADTRRGGPTPSRFIDDWKDLVHDPEVQVVDCCFGHQPGRQEHRLAVVEEAVKAGKPVQIQKPPAMSLAIAEQMAETAREGGIQLTVNQNCRYNPANYTVKQLLTPQRLGKPRIIELQSYWRGNPRTTEMTPATVSHTIHHVDLLRWWIGSECKSVYAKSLADSTLAIYEFENGTVVYHMENHSGVQAHEVQVRINAENAIIQSAHNWNWHLPTSKEHDYVHVWPMGQSKEAPLRLPLPEHVYEPIWSEVNPYLPHKGPFYDLAAPIAGMMDSMGMLLHATVTGETPDNHIDKSLKAYRIALAAHLSSETGKPMSPDEVPSDVVAER
ncbi:MAG: Gfo/Idh/MocA family protein [Phycisphaeraceae bacterium]